MAESSITKRKARPRHKSRKLNMALASVALLILAIGVYVLLTSLSGLDEIDRSSAEEVPTVSLVSLDGSTVSVPDTSRQATVLFAMAYWCGTCIPEAQALARLGQEYGDTVHIVAIDIDPSSTPPLLQRFINAIGENNLTWTFDQDNLALRSYAIRTLDTTIILDGNGREVYRDGYPTTYDVLRTQLEAVVNG